MASGVPFPCTYALWVVVVDRSVAVDLLYLLGLINARRSDSPGGEKIPGFVGQHEQLTWWAYVRGTVALACGWWVGCRENLLGDYTVDERTSLCQVALALRSEHKLEADAIIAEVVHYVGAWGRYSWWVDGFRRAFVRPGGFREERCRLRVRPGQRG